jgi:hypothetical protein
MLKVVLAPAQLVGYLAFALGVFSFAQRDDRRLKGAVALQALSYALHFALLGRSTAAVASGITAARSLLSLRTRSRWVLAAILSANVILGITVARGLAGWLPVVASCVGSLAFFLLSGIPMRLTMLGGTTLWLCNAVLVGSIGSTALELTIAFVNGGTILRLWCARHHPREQRPSVVAVADGAGDSSLT